MGLEDYTGNKDNLSDEQRRSEDEICQFKSQGNEDIQFPKCKDCTGYNQSCEDYIIIPH